MILGAASPFIDIPYESLESGIRKIFGRKGEKVVQLNIEALKAGREFAKSIHRLEIELVETSE